MKTKLISVRLPEDVINDIDGLAVGNPGFTRTLILERFVTACLRCSSPDGLWDLMSVQYPEEKGWKLHFARERLKSGLPTQNT